MLRTHQEPAPAHTSLKRVNDEANTGLHAASLLNTQHSADHSSLFWPSSDASSALSSSVVLVDSTPKTGSHLALDNIPAHSGTDFLQIGLASLDGDLSTSSGPPSATTTSGTDSLVFTTSSNPGDQSSPAMSSSSNYNFETPSLHQVSALTAPFATSSPNVGSVGNADGNAAKTSPSQNEPSWYHANSHDKKPYDGPSDSTSSSIHTPYSYKSNTAASAHQAQQTQSGYYNDHDYHGHGAHPGVSQYFQHRASISGPLMESTPYPERYESAAAAQAPAPPRVHGLAAWENASGSARPHTADGLFGQFGSVGTHDASADSSIINPVASSSRSYTPGAHAAALDAYYAQRRMSMPDPSVAGGGSKVFSYMTSGEDGAMSSSSSGINSGSHGYGGHYFGGGYSAGASKKRPRRRYDEIERLYPCSWPGCTKSYGTLNHLNAHVAMQKHGPKRSPSEFKDMRKAWRKQKKEEEHRRQSRQMSLTEQSLRPSYSSSSFAGLPSSELVGSTSGNASVLPIAPPPALSGVGLPGIGQMPSSLAHLSRYSMSSASSTHNTNPNQQSPFYLNGASADAGLHSAASSHAHAASTSAPPLQYSNGNDSSRLGYASSSSVAPAATGNANPQYSNFGAYLHAHRGSVQ